MSNVVYLAPRRSIKEGKNWYDLYYTEDDIREIQNCFGCTMREIFVRRDLDIKADLKMFAVGMRHKYPGIDVDDLRPFLQDYSLREVRQMISAALPENYYKIK